MKRWLSILAVFGCIVALSGCKNENEKGQAYFNAKVLEINKEYVDVRCIEAFNSGFSDLNLCPINNRQGIVIDGEGSKVICKD